MSRIDLSGVWSLNCSKSGFQPIPARIPGDNCSALIDAGLAGDPNIGFNEMDFQWVREYDWCWTVSENKWVCAAFSRKSACFLFNNPAVSTKIGKAQTG